MQTKNIFKQNIQITSHLPNYRTHW